MEPFRQVSQPGNDYNKRRFGYTGTDGHSDGFVAVCAVNDITENRAKTLLIKGENIAVFRYSTPADPLYERILLIGLGKHGADSTLHQWEITHGSLIYKT